MGMLCELEVWMKKLYEDLKSEWDIHCADD